MKFINRKNSYKVIRYQVAIIVAVVLTQMTMLFFHDYRVVAFQKKDGSSWEDVAMKAQGDNSACQLDLQAAIDDKHTAIMAANPDLEK